MSDDTNIPATAFGAQLPDHKSRIADLLGGIANIQNSIMEAGGVASAFPFIGINSDGLWAYGQDRTEVEEGSVWAMDVRSWQHGYIAWPDQKTKDRKPLAERMVAASQPLPLVASLPDVGQPYQLQFAFELLCMSGEDRGIMALYKNGSYGAKTLMQDMVEKVRAQARIDSTRLCPLVVLAIRSYWHTEWKKNIHNPVLQIQKWISFEEYDAFERTSTSQAEPEPEPVAPAPPPPPVVTAARGTGRRPTPAPQPEPEVAAAAARRPGRRIQPDA